MPNNRAIAIDKESRRRLEVLARRAGRPLHEIVALLSHAEESDLRRMRGRLRDRRPDAATTEFVVIPMMKDFAWADWPEPRPKEDSKSKS